MASDTLSTGSKYHDKQSLGPDQDSGGESSDDDINDGFDRGEDEHVLHATGSSPTFLSQWFPNVHSDSEITSHTHTEPIGIYQYEPLDLEGRCFRLLRLRKGDELRLECDLFQADMDGDNLMPFEALSYTWGNLCTSHSIKVNGKGLPITTNLYSALRNLQLEDVDRLLWVDAICIDQNNDKERGHQVGQMGDIFSRADQVIFWLGGPTYNSNLVMDALKRFERRAQKEASGGWHPSDERWQMLWSQLQPMTVKWPPDPSLPKDLSSLQKEGLQYLLGRNWFRRVWIIQEVARARRAIVCCGSKSVTSRIFVLAPSVVGVEPNSHCQAILDIMPGPLRESSWWKENRDLYTLVRKFGRRSEASDPRDMIYALLGVAELRQDYRVLLPDYTKSEAEVVAAATLALFDLEDPPYCTMKKFLESFGFLNTRALTKIAISDQSQQLIKFLEYRGELTKLTSTGVDEGRELRKVSKEARTLIDRKGIPRLDYGISEDPLNEITVILVNIATENTRYGLALLQFLFAYPDVGVRATVTGTVEKALSDQHISKEVIDSFLTRHGHQLIIAATQSSNEKFLRSLLGRPNLSKLGIPHDALVAATQNVYNGDRMIDSLFSVEHDRTIITEEVLESAARNRSRGSLIMIEMLLKHRESEACITDRIISAAAENRRIASKLIRLHLHIGFGDTQEGSALYTLLFPHEKPSLLSTTGLIMFEVRREECEEEVLRFLLENRASEVRITEEILELAERQSFAWCSKFLLLLQAFYTDYGCLRHDENGFISNRTTDDDYIPASAYRSLLAMEELKLDPFQKSQLLEYVLKRSTETLGEVHPDTLCTAVNLGHAYAEQGSLSEAETLLKGVMKRWRRRFGYWNTTTNEAVELLAYIQDQKAVQQEPKRRWVSFIFPKFRSAS
ncbi:heterokaryon incompatibility protein-domain-containing protein [Lophiotrema nucula]|uniref:Heterokaryon incompatibility protein-domain-containing protein n=1 Tax=Lophiotrema nucula TaxID=690887 RepID=A0A6A5YEV0_9PLEO|nr:heterokaryon incompatibility protein-domain-containing protein [Lophiotrema nucula]